MSHVLSINIYLHLFNINAIRLFYKFQKGFFHIEKLFSQLKLVISFIYFNIGEPFPQNSNTLLLKIKINCFISFTWPLPNKRDLQTSTYTVCKTKLLNKVFHWNVTLRREVKWCLFHALTHWVFQCESKKSWFKWDNMMLWSIWDSNSIL